MNLNRIIVGDALETLRELPDGFVHCVVTSPPYWSLRDYGVEGQLGLEPTIGEHVENMVEVFREVRRVLHPSGTLWLNYGDSYASDHSQGPRQHDGFNDRIDEDRPGRPAPGGLKPKDLVGMPWRVAFALQADGWWLRSDIIWSKRNPMPSSVMDRPTPAHEYVFLLTRSHRYYFDWFAIRERATTPAGTLGAKASAERASEERVNSRPAEYAVYDGWRRKRDVWTTTTNRFKGAHSATFPEDLIRPCVLAGSSSRGACPNCGSPWQRVVETTYTPGGAGGSAGSRGNGTEGMVRMGKNKGADPERMVRRDRTTGWVPGCDCDAGEPIPSVILDPFMGFGTTAVVAANNGRDWVGVELNPKYASMAGNRIRQYASQMTLDRAGLAT